MIRDRTDRIPRGQKTQETGKFCQIQGETPAPGVLYFSFLWGKIQVAAAPGSRSSAASAQGCQPAQRAVPVVGTQPTEAGPRAGKLVEVAGMECAVSSSPPGALLTFPACGSCCEGIKGMIHPQTCHPSENARCTLEI